MNNSCLSSKKAWIKIDKALATIDMDMVLIDMDIIAIDMDIIAIDMEMTAKEKALASIDKNWLAMEKITTTDLINSSIQWEHRLAIVMGSSLFVSVIGCRMIIFKHRDLSLSQRERLIHKKALAKVPETFRLAIHEAGAESRCAAHVFNRSDPFLNRLPSFSASD